MNRIALANQSLAPDEMPCAYAITQPRRRRRTVPDAEGYIGFVHPEVACAVDAAAEPFTIDAIHALAPGYTHTQVANQMIYLRRAGHIQHAGPRRGWHEREYRRSPQWDLTPEAGPLERAWRSFRRAMKLDFNPASPVHQLART